jgi:hypothetical protein
MLIGIICFSTIANIKALIFLKSISGQFLFFLFHIADLCIHEDILVDF